MRRGLMLAIVRTLLWSSPTRSGARDVPRKASEG
jgi:hypothetical protein